MTEANIQPLAQPTSPRLISLDVVRGITIAFMILVNNNGDFGYAYWPLNHSAWSGWTPTDLVFPSFLLMVGIAIVFSTESRRARGESRTTLLFHALRRTIILILLGLVVNGFPHFQLASLRLYGVLQRIAVCYLVASVLYLWSRRAAWICCIAAAALLGYWIMMRWVPIPGYGMPMINFPLLDKNINWAAYVDRMIFPGRLYEGVRDPEGLLSDIPAIATTLIGVLTGLWLRTRHSQQRKVAGLLLVALCGLIVGEIWNIWFPINKKLWTSSYVLFAAGWTLLLLASCYWLIEIKQWRRGWTKPWLIFGSNAITAYVFSELLASTLYSIRVRFGGPSMMLQPFIYQKYFSRMVNPSFGSLIYSLVFVMLCFLPVVVLFHKRIFIKV